MGLFDSIKNALFGSDAGDDAHPEDPLADLTLDQLREGYLLDYEMRTWEVTQHAKYDYEGWPADEWTLEHQDDVLFLEYEEDDGDVFNLSSPVEMVDVEAGGEPLRSVVRDGTDPPATLTYEDTTYELEEEGPATRTVDGKRQELYYWVYGAGDDFLALERYGQSDWNAYAGREVEPYEFDNILPKGDA